MRRLWIALALVAGIGCKKGNALVVVTVTATDAAPVRGVATLSATAMVGGQARTFGVPLGGTVDLPPSRTFGIDVPSSLSGAFALHLDARDGSGALVGAGDGSTTVSAGSRSDVTVTLNANGPGGNDMASVPDLSTGSTQDLAGPVRDLAFVDHLTVVSTNPATTNSFRGVWASGPTDVWAVDASGTVWHSGGGTSAFTPQTTFTGAPNLYGISGSGPNDIFISGMSSAGPTVWHNSNGPTGAWSAVVGVGGSVIYGVFALDSQHIWTAGGAAGGAGPVINFSSGVAAGFAPQTVPAVSGALNRVWGASSTDLWAVGSVNAFLHYANGSWTSVSPLPLPPPPRYWPHAGSQTLFAVGGSSTSDVYVGGMFGYLIHYNGVSWSHVNTLPAPVNNYGDFVAAWATSPSDVWLVDQDDYGSDAGMAGRIVHFDGINWKLVTLPVSVLSPILRDVSGSGPGDVFIVGDSGLILHYP